MSRQYLSHPLIYSGAAQNHENEDDEKGAAQNHENEDDEKGGAQNHGGACGEDDDSA